jgi:hypothetical protein
MTGKLADINNIIMANFLLNTKMLYRKEILKVGIKTKIIIKAAPVRRQE